MTTSNSERFLNAFSLIENEMTKRMHSTHYVSYVEMARRLAKVDKTYRRYRRYLEEFADLRNAIVHERIDGEVIAEPHLKEVEKIEQIAQILSEPEKVFPRFKRHVEIAFMDEKLALVVSRMKPKHYSKLPVYNREGIYEGLLTTDAFSYFVVDHIKDINCDFPDVQVKEVIEFDQKGRHVRFFSRHATLVEVIMEFEQALYSGQRLNEIIITEHGEMHESPIGIISVSDLPNIYSAVNKNLIL
jgi:predicted transcriptional regulator